MVLRLYPQPSLFDDSVELVRSATPVTRSPFYLRRPHFVPWSVEPTTFILETDEPSAVHSIIVNRTDTVAFVPGQKQYTVSLQLVKGANHIDIETPTQRTYVTVAATAVESWFHALGREYYLSAAQRLTDITNHFRTPWTTRISAHLLPFTDLFLPTRMPKVQQTRMAIMTSVGQRLGHGDGVIRMASALSYSTPPVSKAMDAEFAMPGANHLYPYVTTHPTTGEVQGRVLDLWTPNHCLAAHQALFQMALAMCGEDEAPLCLVDKDDAQLLLSFQGGPTEVHFIDPQSPECDDIESFSSCDASVRSFAQMISTFDIMMMSPQLPFDEVVEFPLLFGSFDENNWFDASTGHAAPGLGGGDDEFDTVDSDDPFGEGFFGVSLSRRMDLGCLDTRVQVGQRMSKFTAPITSSSLPALTPEPPLVEGLLLTIDADAGAPAPTTGATSFWATCAKTFLYEGDHIRFENPDLETQVVSAWPVFQSTDQIIKSDETATYSLSGVQKVITAPAGFFEPRHEGLGLRIAGTDHYCIASVSTDGTQAVIVGNPTVPGGGALIVNVYTPLRDRQDESEPLASVLQNVAGRAVYEFTISPGLAADLVTSDQASYRAAPRTVGAVGAGESSLLVATNVKPLPGDLLYFDSAASVAVLSAIESGSHATTGYPIYDIVLDGVTPAAYADDEALFSVRANSCWPNGDPVTPLMLLSIAPAEYLTV